MTKTGIHDPSAAWYAFRLSLLLFLMAEGVGKAAEPGLIEFRDLVILFNRVYCFVFAG